MGLHLLNVSVDTVDPNPEYFPEDLSFNDQESIIEIIVEKVLGYGNVIEEYDDNDVENNFKKDNIKIDLFLQYANIKNRELFNKKIKKRLPDYNTSFSSVFLQLDPPPPKNVFLLG